MITYLHVDTHIVVWLAGGKENRIPAPTRTRMSSSLLRISPMVRLELAYLHEIGRLSKPPETALRTLEHSIGLNLDDQPFDRVAEVAARTTFTRDPFDRIIAAQAIAANARLVTADERIRAALPETALWDYALWD